MSIRRAVPDLHGDPAASRAFYEEVIGMELSMDMGWIATFVSRTNETALTNEPWGVRRFFVRDPNGAVINVMQHIT